MVATARALTLDEFLRLPERKPALQFVDGRVTRKVSPKGRHSTLQSEFVQFFDRAGRPGRIARAFPELRTTYAGASHVPDVAVYRWERIPREPNGEIAEEFFEPPDIAVEIASPRQSRRKLREQCQWYAENGVPISLLVDPRDRSIRRFHSGIAPRVMKGSDVVDFDAVIPGLRLVVQELFQALMV